MAAARKKRAATKKKKTTRRKRAAAAAPKKPDAPRAWGLAIEGDWPRSAFAIGALDRFRKVHGVTEYSVVAGSGAGAWIAALLAQDRWTDLVALYAGLDPRSFLRPRHTHLKRRHLLSVFLSSVLRTQSLYLIEEALPQLVRETVDPDALVRSPTELHFVTLDLRTGKPRAFCNRTDSEEDLLGGLLASVSRPVVLPPVHVGAERHPCVDGSLFPSAALSTCLAALHRYGGPVADRILAVSTTPAPGEDAHAGRGDLLAVAERTFALLTGDGASSGVREASLANAILVLRDRMGAKAFEAALAGMDSGTRAHVERLASRRNVPVVHLRPAAAAFDARAALREGGAAAERAFG